jgi:hypothetical protein
LKLNVASLLRTNWQDPLQKYLGLNQDPSPNMNGNGNQNIGHYFNYH